MLVKIELLDGYADADGWTPRVAYVQTDWVTAIVQDEEDKTKWGVYTQDAVEPLGVDAKTAERLAGFIQTEDHRELTDLTTA